VTVGRSGLHIYADMPLYLFQSQVTMFRIIKPEQTEKPAVAAKSVKSPFGLMRKKTCLTEYILCDIILWNLLSNPKGGYVKCTIQGDISFIHDQ